MEWIKTEIELPRVDENDAWNKKYKISKDVWTYSKFGRHVGRYIYYGEMWVIDNVSSSDGINVTHWMELPPPPKD